MRHAIATALVLTSALLPAAQFARAETPSGTPATAPREPSPALPQRLAASTTYGHAWQIGLGFRLGSGYRVIAPYEEEDCGELDSSGSRKSICGGIYPFWLELSPSLGVTDGLEVLVDLRFPLQTPGYTGAKGFFIAPGVKYYADPESAFKFYLTGQIVFELQDQSGNPQLGSFDFGLRSVLGVQYDLWRYLGLYAQTGLVIAFQRWLSFVVDFGGGLQVRY